MAARYNVRMSPDYRMREARKLARAGKHQEALEEYLWCFDHGLEDDPDWDCMRMSFLLVDIRRLGDSYPPALAALEERRAAVEKKLLAEGTNLKLAQDLVALNDALGTSDRTVKLLDDLAAGTSAQRELLKQMLPLVVHELVEAQRYEPFRLFSEEVLAIVEGLLKTPVDWNHHIENAADYYEGLLGAGEAVKAQEVADKLTRKFGTSLKAFFVLAARAARLGRPDMARLVLQKGLQSVPGNAALPLRAFLDELPQGGGPQ
jgi:hypothetical protein